MKKYILSTLCALTLIACAKSDEDMVAVPATAPETIYASFEEPTTRTYVEQDKYLRWHAEDEISFFSTTYNLQYRFQGNTGDNNGSFTKITTDLVTGNALANNYAVYPYAASNAISDEGVISVTLPATQAYAENSFGRGANTMVAATNGTMDNVLRFKNAGGYLKLQLYGTDATVKSVALQGNKGEKIAGEATITAAYGNDPVVTMADTATDVVTIDCGEGVTLSNDATTPTTFWFVLPETTFAEGFTVTVTDTEGGTFVKSTSNSFTIDRNMIQPMKSLEAVIEPAGPQETWKIYYTATAQVNPYATDVFGANLISNEFDDATGEGVMTFDGKVTIIGESAFSGCKSLTGIIIPESVTKIDDYAFYQCSEMEKLIIPKSVTSFGETPFRYCSGKLTINCNIPNSSYNSDRDKYTHFYYAEFTEVTIGKDVTYIGNNAFSYIPTLHSVYCDIVTPPTLGTNAFAQNATTRKIYVPAESIESYETATNWDVYIGNIFPYDFITGEIVGMPNQNPITYDWYINATNNFYEIDTPEELVAFSKLTNGDSEALAIVGATSAISFEGATVNLTADIDLTNYCGKIVGSWKPITNFKGVFDGGNHVINNLYCNSKTSTGLFLSISNATIKNLIVQGNIVCHDIDSYGVKIGGVVAEATSSIVENCISHVAISTRSTYQQTEIGGICGCAKCSTFIACQSTADIVDYIQEWEWYNYIGGIVGYCYDDRAAFVACIKSSGSILEENTQSYTYIGGILGYMFSSPYIKIYSCYTSIAIAGRQPGHITSTISTNGYAYNNIVNCYYAGTSNKGSGSGIGTKYYDTYDVAYDKGTARSANIVAEIALMNNSIDEWNLANPDYICNYRYELDDNNMPILVKYSN